jgi:hypothetical protein
LKRTATIASLLVFGVISLLLSFWFDAVLLVFISLGLIIWGTSLIFMSSNKLVRTDLVSSQLRNFMLTLDSLLKKLDVNSETYFLPPKISGENPVQKIVDDKSQPYDISLVPSGLDLAWSFEKKSKVDFLDADFDYLKEFLSIVFTDELNLATDFEMVKENSTVHVTIKDFVLQELCENVHKVDGKMCNRVPCPVCSAIACALTKVTHAAIGIERTRLSNGTLEVWFKISELKPE